MYAMTAKKDNVVSLEDVKQSKLHASMDQIGEDFHGWAVEQCDKHDVVMWTPLFSVLCNILWTLEDVAESGEEGSETAGRMIVDFRDYFQEAMGRCGIEQGGEGEG